MMPAWLNAEPRKAVLLNPAPPSRVPVKAALLSPVWLRLEPENAERPSMLLPKWELGRLPPKCEFTILETARLLEMADPPERAELIAPRELAMPEEGDAGRELLA
jgi:hypothetical protein